MIEGPTPQTPRDIYKQKKSGDFRGVLAGGPMSKVAQTVPQKVPQKVPQRVPLRIRALIEEEIDAFDVTRLGAQASLVDFVTSLCAPELMSVNFSGGVTQECWTVTRSNGAYRVIFMPEVGYFSLCVVSQFGPLDIGVHGAAIGCFTSV